MISGSEKCNCWLIVVIHRCSNHQNIPSFVECDNQLNLNEMMTQELSAG